MTRTTISSREGVWKLELHPNGEVRVVSFERSTPKAPPAPPPAPMRGLGDAIARATTAVGIRPCGGCKKRQEALNRLVPFKENPPPSAPS
jgi:hypothetical protein